MKHRYITVAGGGGRFVLMEDSYGILLESKPWEGLHTFAKRSQQYLRQEAKPYRSVEFGRLDYPFIVYGWERITIPMVDLQSERTLYYVAPVGRMAIGLIFQPVSKTFLGIGGMELEWGRVRGPIFSKEEEARKALMDRIRQESIRAYL